MNTHIAGIPCLVQVDYFFVQKPLGPRADSDLDCYGYSDIDFTVLDRKGYAAPWLAKKMTSEDEERIKDELIEAHNNYREEP